MRGFDFAAELRIIQWAPSRDVRDVMSRREEEAIVMHVDGDVPGRRALRWSFMMVLISCCLGVGVFGSPWLEATIGISDHVVRWHYAPVRVEVSQLDHPIQGSLTLRQLIGNPAERPDIVEHDLRTGEVANGIYEATIPIYDPLNAAEVVLRDAAGEALGLTKVNLRLHRRIAPFPTVCGYPLQVKEDAVFTDVSDLPRDWWGLDAVQTLWLARVSPQRNTWTTIAEWVLAGGSLVVVTGSDFFRLDTPILRDLLPISDPRLETTEEGLRYLTGNERPGSRKVLHRGALPLLVIGQFGMGHVALVTVGAEDLTSAEVASIVDHVPYAELVQVERTAEAVLRETSVVRPSFAAAPAIVVAVLGGFLVYAGRSKAHPRVGLAALIGFTLVLAVLSGIYTNYEKRPLDIYLTNTEVSIEQSVGVLIGSYGLYNGLASEADLSQPKGSYPRQSAVLASMNVPLDVRGGEEVTVVSLREWESRSLSYYGRTSALLSVTRQEGVATVTNLGLVSASAGIILIDGIVYSLSEIPSGVHTVSLQNGCPAYLYDSQYTAIDLLLLQLWTRLELNKGLWLIAIREDEVIQRGPETGRKVRTAQIQVVKGAAL
jgi:hypothetical protein